MYEGNPVQFFGTYANDAYVEFVVNPSPDATKTFDNMLLTATDKLQTMDIFVARETGLIPQAAYNIPLGVDSRGEGTYQIKTFRDENGGRIRGLFANAKVKWNVGAGSPQVTLFSAVTSFRPSI
jgi:hypothetical protein